MFCVCFPFCFLVSFLCLYILSFFCVVLLCVFTFCVPCCDVRYDFLNKKRCSVRLYLQLFVGGSMSYLRYMCLFTYTGVQHIMWCVFDLFVFVLCTLCCQFLWIVHLWLPLRYSLTFIYYLSCMFCFGMMFLTFVLFYCIRMKIHPAGRCSLCCPVFSHCVRSISCCILCL